MTTSNLENDVPPVAAELRELSEGIFGGIERIREPIPTSELTELVSLHEGAVITVADSIASAMDTVSSSAQTLAFLLENQSATAYEPVHAGLMRQMLVGAFTVCYVLGPADVETRETRARTLVAAEYASLYRAAIKVKQSKSAEYRGTREDAETWLDDIEADRKKFNIPRNADDKTGTITEKGSEEFVNLLVGAFRKREDVSEQDLERLRVNIPDTAAWAWQITSGFAHAYDWPYRVTGEEDVPRFLTQLVLGIQMASMLSGSSALVSRENFHGFHSVMMGEGEAPGVDEDVEA